MSTFERFEKPLRAASQLREIRLRMSFSVFHMSPRIVSLLAG